MPSDRWLRKVETTQNVSQSDVRRIAEEKARKQRETAAVPEYRSTEVNNKNAQQRQENVSDSVPQYRSTAVPERNFYRKGNEASDRLDRTLTPAESKVLDHLVRLSVGFNKDRCRVRVSTLMERTGYNSDKTVRAALSGLELKGIIRRLSHRNSPLGDEYQILTYSSTAVPQYRSTPAENTPVLEVKNTGELNTNRKDNIDDDDAFADFVKVFREAAKEVTGKDPSRLDGARWQELAELLMAELKIAAARTEVSSVPAFLTEHLRRRLWKVDKKQIGREEKSANNSDKQSFTPEQIRNCPDCGGSGMYYPEGFEKGVARCRHERLKLEENPTPKA